MIVLYNVYLIAGGRRPGGMVLSEYIELGAFSKKGRQSYTNQPDWPFKDTFVYIHSVESAREC